MERQQQQQQQQRVLLSALAALFPPTCQLSFMMKCFSSSFDHFSPPPPSSFAAFSPKSVAVFLQTGGVRLLVFFSEIPLAAATARFIPTRRFGTIISGCAMDKTS